MTLPGAALPRRMPQFTPVVCALDLAPESTPALVAAVALAERAGGALHLVTVRPPPAADAYRAPSDPEAAVRAVVEVTVDKALGAGACARIAPEIVVARQDDPAESVLGYARDVGAGVLVMGTSGRVGIQRFRLGSVAEDVMRQAPCPVLVVPNESASRAPGPERPVLVPVDFSQASARALQLARAFADLYDAPIEVLNVEDGAGRAALAASAMAVRKAGLPSQHLSLDADLRAFVDDVGAGEVGIHVVDGAPADQVVAQARTMDAAVVVMGTHGRRGPARALFGSVAEAALRRLRCPVLTVRPPDS